jgi:hypothetical protein
MAQPRRVMTAALAAGRYLLTTWPSPVRCVIRGLATTRRIPITTSTLASPTLKLSRMTNPNVTLFKAMAISKTTRASGHGTNPPEMPSDRRLPRETSEARRRPGASDASWAL